MKKVCLTILCLVCMGIFFFPIHLMAQDNQVLRYSSSAQVYDAFLVEGIEAFQKETGIKVDLFVGTSRTAVNRLMNNVADIASTVENVNTNYKEYGYQEIPFCVDPLVVITHQDTPITNITSDQLRAIFNGEILSWQELGGPFREITVIVPFKNSGAYTNFKLLALKRNEVTYDIMTYKSTMVTDLVERLPYSISFIAQGVAITKSDVKILSVDGISYKDPNYPYFQTFSFVTRGEPQGAVKAFIDFAFSPKATEIIKKHGMKPIR